MYLCFSDQLTGKELQSVLGYPGLREAPFILFTAARKYRSWELVRRKRTPSPRLHPGFVPRGVLLDQGMYVALFVGLKWVRYLSSCRSRTCRSRKVISADTHRAKPSKGRLWGVPRGKHCTDLRRMGEVVNTRASVYKSQQNAWQCLLPRKFKTAQR